MTDRPPTTDNELGYKIGLLLERHGACTRSAIVALVKSLATMIALHANNDKKRLEATLTAVLEDVSALSHAGYKVATTLTNPCPHTPTEKSN